MYVNFVDVKQLGSTPGVERLLTGGLCNRSAEEAPRCLNDFPAEIHHAADVAYSLRKYSDTISQIWGFRTVLNPSGVGEWATPSRRGYDGGEYRAGTEVKPIDIFAQALRPKCKTVGPQTVWSSLCPGLWELYGRVFTGYVALEGSEHPDAGHTVREICKLMGPEVAQTLYRGIASIEHTYCRSDTCAHEINLGILSNALIPVQTVHSGECYSSMDANRVEQSAQDGSVDGGRSDVLPRISVARQEATADFESQFGRFEAAWGQGAGDGFVITPPEGYSPIYEQNPRASFDVEECSSTNGQGGSTTPRHEADSSGGVEADRGLHSDGYGSDGPRDGNTGPYGTEQMVVMENVLLCQEGASRSLGSITCYATAQVTNNGVGVEEPSVLSPQQDGNVNTIEEECEDIGAGRLLATRELCSSRPDIVVPKATRAVLANSNSQQLYTQRDAVPIREGPSSSPGDGAGSEQAADCASQQDVLKCNPNEVISRLGVVDIYLSTEQTKALYQNGYLLVGRAIEYTGRVRQIICQVGEVNDLRQGWGSPYDPSPDPQVQPDVRDVYESNRNVFVPIAGPHVGANESGHTDGCQRQESVPESIRSTEVVVSDAEPSEPELGFVTVGHARKRANARGNAQVLPKRDARPVPAEPAASPVKKPLSNKRGAVLQNGGRRHEWRYDDSFGELHCGDCNSNGLSHDVVRRCQRARFSKMRQIARNERVVFDSTKVIKYRYAKNSSPTPNGDIRRRRRPRNDSGQVDTGSSAADTTKVLGSNGPRSKNRSSGYTVSSDSVLPAQTVQNKQRLDNVPRSKEGRSYSDSVKQQVSARSSPVSQNNMGSPRAFALPGASAGAIVPSVGEKIVQRRQVRTKGNVARNVGDPAPDKGSVDAKPAKKPTNNNTRTKSNVLGTVGSNTGRAGDVRKHDNTGAPKVDKVADVKTVESRNTGSHPNIIYDDGDAITCGEYYLMHCVGGDLTLGAGFAKAVVRHHGRPTENRIKVGQVAYHKSGNLTVANMCIKPKSADPAAETKEAYSHLATCVDKVMKSVKDAGHKWVACPNLIGCGLDRLNRRKVLSIIQQAAAFNNVKVAIYSNREGQALDK